jgi:GNAT superfamily N-acetyltransferase
VTREDSGSDYFGGDAAAWFAGYQHQEYRVTRLIAAVAADGSLIGIGNCAYEREGTSCVTVIAVLAENRGRGIEDALLEELERIGRDAGKSVFDTYSYVAASRSGGDQIASPTGFGSVPADDDWTRLFLTHGYALGQVERASAFDLQSDLTSVRRILEDALDVAGPDYEPLWWLTPTPDTYVDGYAAAVSRLETDAPSGELETDEIVWDADRIRHREQMKHAAGIALAVTAVRHIPTGDIVAYNEIQVLADRTRPSENIGTLVLAGHRGRRLGTIVKAHGLLKWHEAFPESPVVQTFNAEENRYMLDVNERVGFRPICWTGEWQKKLTPRLTPPNE